MVSAGTGGSVRDPQESAPLPWRGPRRGWDGRAKRIGRSEGHSFTASEAVPCPNGRTVRPRFAGLDKPRGMSWDRSAVAASLLAASERRGVLGQAAIELGHSVSDTTPPCQILATGSQPTEVDVLGSKELTAEQELRGPFAEGMSLDDLPPSTPLTRPFRPIVRGGQRVGRTRQRCHLRAAERCAVRAPRRDDRIGASSLPRPPSGQTRRRLVRRDRELEQAAAAYDLVRCPREESTLRHTVQETAALSSNCRGQPLPPPGGDGVRNDRRMLSDAT